MLILQIKRIVDVILAIAILLISFWQIIILIIVHSCVLGREPFLFIQKRVGKNNIVFRCLKCRTMHNLSNSDNVYIAENYQSLLRKFKMDEIPQILNILEGKMSFVGPRPLMVSEIDEYNSFIPNIKERHKMKPGLTGLSQITINERKGKSKKIIKDKMNYDIWYCNNWNPMIDTKIVYYTIVHIISQNYISVTKIHKNNEKYI